MNPIVVPADFQKALNWYFAFGAAAGAALAYILTRRRR